MYGVVLMMALSGAGEAPQCWCHRSCGCTGYYSCACYGGACYGCSCYGCSCYGGHHRHHCWGGCHGCWGGCYGCACSGVYGYYAPVVDGVPPAATTPPGPPPGAPMPPPGTPPPPMKGTSIPAPATIQVSVPAQTVLYFDGVKMNSTASSRRFSTPTLEAGKAYFYNVKAEVERDGQTITTTQRVVVRAGQNTQVQFDFAPTGSLTARQD